MSHKPSQRRSIVFVVALLMTVVVGLGIASMVGSMVVAQINRGMATAVNQSGTLRMQSYRIATAMTDTSLPFVERQALTRALADEYEQRITSTRLTQALPKTANDPVRLAYERVLWRWINQMRKAVAAFVNGGNAQESLAGRDAYLAQVNDFVADVHGLVRVLEDRAERRIEALRWMQAVALVLTICTVLVTLVVLQTRVVAPLGELLRSADRVRRGDFSGKVSAVGGDELGRLGAAMNLMTAGLSSIYEELEERIAGKSRDLARTNRSLELLFRTSRTLDEAPISEDILRRILLDLRGQLGLADVALCLRGIADGECGRIGTSPPESTHWRPETSAPGDQCGPCDRFLLAAACGDRAADQDWAQRQCLDFQVGDAEQSFGVLRVVPAPRGRLESWQRPLLESVASHLGAALIMRRRMRESRRLMLHEERSIIARELHDSLAQSLSYLKIQAARLDAALLIRDGGVEGPGMAAPPGKAEPAEILAEMRAGISSAYRQLRELLTTFRLKMDEAGLGSALAETTREFMRRGGLSIRLRDRLPAGLLSANEEVHVLQIVREALSNVVRHADARCCRVVLRLDGDGGVCVAIIDDGREPPSALIGATASPAGAEALHHGLTIMRERTQSLGGELALRPGTARGLRVLLRFRPRGRRHTRALGASRAETASSAHEPTGEPA